MASQDEAIVQEFEGKVTREVLFSITAAKKERRATRSRLTKACNMLNGTLANSNASIIDIQDGIGQLEQAVRDLEEKDFNVHTHIDSQSVCDADTNLAMPWYNPAQQTIRVAKNKIQTLSIASAALTATTAAITNTSQTSPAASPVSVKLPKVELPDFFGTDPAEYQTFIAQFNSLVHDGPADKVQKLLYLKACCKGEAKKVADGFTVSQQNYDELYQVLKNTYGKPRLVIQSYVNRILNLEPFKMAGLKHHLNVLEASLRCLAEYNIDPEGLAAILVPLTETKMPRELFTKWREVIHEDDSFSTTKLVSYLHEKQECMAPSQSSQEKGHSKETPKDVRPKTTALLTSQSEGAKHCFFCEKKGHGANDCYALGKKPKEEREEFFKKNSLCFKCTEKGHFAGKCTNEPLHCKRCKKRHPTVLHPENKEEKPRGSAQKAQETSHRRAKEKD